MKHKVWIIAVACLLLLTWFGVNAKNREVDELKQRVERQAQRIDKLEKESKGQVPRIAESFFKEYPEAKR